MINFQNICEMVHMEEIGRWGIGKKFQEQTGDGMKPNSLDLLALEGG
jgi:hypothetical protein